VHGTLCAEVMHSHLRKSIIHALEMRGSYDFKDYKELEKFLKTLNKKRIPIDMKNF